MKRTWTICIVGFITLAVLTAGCSRPGAGTSEKASEKGDGDHEHEPGKHGGVIVEIGRNSYHAEAVFGEKGLVRLYMLAKDETQVHEVEAQDLAAFAKAEGDTKAVEIKLEPKPAPGDSKGKTSVFEGTLPESLRDKRVEVTVPSIRIDGRRFRFAFKNYKEAAHGGMPAPLGSDKMKKLFATAKGKYTEADIKANGVGVTPAEKYGNEMTEHDDNPKKGDKICPISRTKANPKITWVVGGKTYQFCCTPCINEFVKKAQEKPDQVLAPEEYVKR